MAQQEPRIEIYEGVFYTLPPQPKIKDIRGSHLKPKDQVWYRNEQYLSYDWSEDTKSGNVWYLNPAEGQLEWLQEEIDRILNGEWIMINGKPVFQNNFSYFYHNWFKNKEGLYPEFRDSSLEFMRFMELVFADHRCRGGNAMKGRRKGVSSMCMSIMLQFGLIKQNTEQGITSKSAIDAEKIFKLMLVNAYSRLPSFLKPRISGNDTPVKTMHITKQAGRITKDGGTGADKQGLNNKIEWRAPSLNVFDGDGLWFLLLDECLHPDTKILCEGYVFKPIKDIQVGDLVYVEGGKLLPVMNKFEGYDEMYLIEQPYSQDYIVSSKHRLYLDQRCKVNGVHDDGIKYHTPEEFINLKKYRKRTTHGVRSSGLNFPEKEMLIDPYIFGAWLGDGRQSALTFICNYKDEPELIQYLRDYGIRNGYKMSERFVKASKKVIEITYLKSSGKTNPLIQELKRLNVFDNKHIPDEYLYNSRQNRLKLLAGLIDTDGHCPRNKKGNRNGSVQIVLSNEGIVTQLKFLAQSLGFSTSPVSYKHTNFGIASYRLGISGNLSELPLVVNKKKFDNHKQQYAFRRNRINVKPIGVGKYVGIQVAATCDEDRRLILEDFTLTMNCGKWEDVAIDEYLEIAMNIIVAGKQIGRIMCITTVNKGDKGGTRYKTVWDNSSQLKRDQLGQTANKLYRLFMPGYMGGRDGGWIDKYGNSVWDTPTPEQTEWLKKDPNTLDPYMGCKAYCELQRKLKANDPEKLQEEIRMFPFNPEEVFKTANNSCYFNTEDLNNQKENLQALLEASNIYRTGLFRKDHETAQVRFEDCKVTDEKSFYWRFLDFPDPEQTNKYEWRGGHKTPINTDYGAAGVDSFSNSEKTAEKGSDAAICIFKRYNALDPENSGMPVGLGVGRPRNKDFFHEQLFWCLEYFGIKALIERSPSDWYDYANRHKLLGYCLKTNLKINGNEVHGISVQDKDGREQHLTEQIEWADNNIRKMFFMRILNDMFDFDIDNRTLYDGCMAFGYSLMAVKDKYRSVVPPVNEAQIIRLFNLKAKYGGR